MQCSLPSGRKMHGAASLAPFAPLLVIYGGWKTGADVVPNIPDLRTWEKVNLEKLSQYVVWSIYSMFTQFFSFLPYQNRKSWNKKREKSQSGSFLVLHGYFNVEDVSSLMFPGETSFSISPQKNTVDFFRNSPITSWGWLVVEFSYVSRSVSTKTIPNGGKKNLNSHPLNKKNRNPHPHLGWFKCGVITSHLSWTFTTNFEGPHFNDLWTFALGADEADLQDEKGMGGFYSEQKFSGQTSRGGVYTGTWIFI